MVSARALAPTRTLRVPAANFRRLISAEPDVGEIVIRAFILRRMGFVFCGEAGITVVGPAAGEDTLRLERFAYCNGYPLKVIDTASRRRTALDQSE